MNPEVLEALVLAPKIELVFVAVTPPNMFVVLFGVLKLVAPKGEEFVWVLLLNKDIPPALGLGALKPVPI